MIDTNKIIEVVKNTPLEKMDNIGVMIDENQMFGFSNWQGIKNVDRWYGRMVYRTTSGHYISGQGASRGKGYASKENALKYAMIEFEEKMKKFGKEWGDVATVK